MTTPKFMQFDEDKAIEAYDDSTGQGCYTQCLHMARYQHQCDLVVMLKLWEIVELQKASIEKVKKRLNSCAYSNTDRHGDVLELAYKTTGKTLESVGKIMKELEE